MVSGPSFKIRFALFSFLLFLVAPTAFAAPQESVPDKDYARHDLTLEKRGFSSASQILTEKRPFNSVAVEAPEPLEGLSTSTMKLGRNSA